MPNLLSAMVANVNHVFGDLSSAELFDLLLGSGHSPLVKRRRALLILSRVRMVALVFALLTPLWIPVDLFLFPHPLGLMLALLRSVATLAFAMLAFSFRRSESVALAHRALALLLAVPTLFFAVSSPLLASHGLTEPAQQAIAAGYAFLPFVMVAGLSVFPITALEGAVLSAPLWLVKLAVTVIGFELLPFASQLGALWLLALLGVVATLAGMSQLHFMSQLVTQASHDGLTRAYTRRVGEELLDIQFIQAQRSGAPLSLVFIDLDNFKQVNDRFGHEEGDNTLRQAATYLRRALRRADVLIRWGGEEFLVVMPQTDLAGAQIALGRLCETGFGPRPDGHPQTASIGIAETHADHIQSWTDLVEKADQRMYRAKQSGKNRMVCDDAVAAMA